MSLSNILVEPVTTANIPKHVLVARTFSPVCNDNHAVVQIMKISPTAATIYSGINLEEFTPLTELQLVESLQQQPCQQTLSTIPATLDIDFTHSKLSPSQQQDLLTLLNDYHGLFTSSADPLGCTAVVGHTISTE